MCVYVWLSVPEGCVVASIKTLIVPHPNAGSLWQRCKVFLYKGFAILAKVFAFSISHSEGILRDRKGFKENGAFASSVFAYVSA